MGRPCAPWPSIYISTSWCRARTCELLSDLCDCPISEGTLTALVELAAQTLEPTIAHIADCISASQVQHGDETGIRVRGKLHWMHVNSTRWLTHLTWHTKRGKPLPVAWTPG